MRNSTEICKRHYAALMPETLADSAEFRNMRAKSQARLTISIAWSPWAYLYRNVAFEQSKKTQVEKKGESTSHKAGKAANADSLF